MAEQTPPRAERRERIISLDALRILACLMIVLIHTPKGSEGYSVFAGALGYVTVPGLDLFFIISGYLLLPARLSALPFLKHRASRLLWPLVIWSVVYILINHAFGAEITVRTFLSLPFSNQASAVFWFVYVLAGLYLVAPIVSPWLDKATKREADFYCILFTIPLFFPVLGYFLTIDHGDTSMFYYFAGYGAMFYYGWYFKRYGNKIRLRWLAAGVVVAMCVPACLMAVHFKADYHVLYWTQSALVVVQSLFWFKLFTANEGMWRRLSPRTVRLITLVSNLSLGIYLVHFAILRRLLWNLDIFDSLSYPVQTAAIWLACFFLSLALCYAVSRIKIGRFKLGDYLIGFSC